MLKPRPLYCPNVVLLDSGKELNFPIEEAKIIVKKFSKINKLIAVYINHEFDDLDESQIVVKSFGYAIYQEKSKQNVSICSQLLNSGASNVYYINTEINMYRKAFVHFYDILSTEYPIICISNLLATQVQAAAIIVPDSSYEIDKNDLREQIIQPTKLFSTSEILMQETVFFNQ